jgi:hypothetical protein
MQAPPPISTLLDELAAFGAAVADALAPDQVAWQWRPDEKEWSLTEVVCHLRDVEREVHQARFRALITADNAFLPGATSDDWVEARQYQRQNGRAALADFVAARQESLALLADVDEEVWQRQGRHAFFGPTTLHELLHLAVRHDRSHWRQIELLLRHAGSDQFPAQSHNL